MILKAEILLDLDDEQRKQDSYKNIQQIVAEDLDRVIKNIEYIKVIIMEVYEPKIITKKPETV